MPGATSVQMMYHPSAPDQSQWIRNSHYYGYNVPVNAPQPLPWQHTLRVPSSTGPPSQYSAQPMRGPIAQPYAMGRPVTESHIAARNLSHISQERPQQDLIGMNSVTWQQHKQGFKEQQYGPPMSLPPAKDQASGVYSSPLSMLPNPFSNNSPWNQVDGVSQKQVIGVYNSVPVLAKLEQQSLQTHVNGYSQEPISPQQKLPQNQASGYFPKVPVSSQQQVYQPVPFNGQMQMSVSPNFDQRSPRHEVPGYFPMQVSPQETAHLNQMNGQYLLPATQPQNCQPSRVNGHVPMPVTPQQDSQGSHFNGHVGMPVTQQKNPQHGQVNGHVPMHVTPQLNSQPNRISRSFHLPVTPQVDEPKSPLNGVYEPVTPTKEDTRHPFLQTVASKPQGSSLNPQCSPETLDTDDPFGVFTVSMWEKLTAENEAKIKRIYNKQTTACKQLFNGKTESGTTSYPNQPVPGLVTVEEPEEEEEEDLALAMAVSNKPRVMRHPAERAPYVTNRGYPVTTDSVSQPPARGPPPLLPIANMIPEGEYSEAVTVDTPSQQVGVSETEVAMRWSRIEKYLDHIKNYIVFIRAHKNSQGCDCQVDEVTFLNARYREQFKEWHVSCFGSKEAQVCVDEAFKKARSNKFLTGWEHIICSYWSQLQETVNKVNKCKVTKSADMNWKPGQKRKAEPLGQLSNQNVTGRPKRTATGDIIPSDRDTCVLIEDSDVYNNAINNHTTQSASQFNINNSSVVATGQDVNMNSISQSSRVGVSSSSSCSRSDLGDRGRTVVEAGPVYGVKLEISRLLEIGGPNSVVDRTQLKALAERAGLSFKTVQNLYFAEMVSLR